jgi:hypothetical protein
MRLSRVTLTVALALLASMAIAEIEKRGAMGDHGINLFWWPKLSVPTGWVQDLGASEDHHINVLHAKGATYDNAPAVIYGRASYEPDKKKRGTLKDYIKNDIEEMKRHRSEVNIAKLPPTKTLHGSLQTYSFNPPRDYERVCYGQEGDYWIVFVINAQSERALRKHLPIFNAVLARYH